MDKHRKALELAGHAGCILLKNGAEIFRVQETMIRILCAYGVTDHNVYVISNGIFATEGEGTDHALSLVRHVPLGGVNLSRIDAVNAVSREICAGKWSMDEAEAALTRVETLTPERPITHIFACALGAASFCYLFGGALLDSVAAFPIGLLLQIYLFAAQKRHSAFMPYIWGSVLVTLLSGLLAVLPGAQCVVGRHRRHCADGAGRDVHHVHPRVFQWRLSLRRDSLHQRHSDRRVHRAGRMRRRDAAGLYGRHCAMMGQVLSAFLGVFSFAILFHAPRRSYLACAVCGAVAWGCYLLAAPMGLFLATTLAAIVLTLLSRMLSIALKMPSTVFIVTGIFPLVPGAGIYHTAYALVSRNMEAFTLRGMQTLALAGAIALGILIGMGFPKLLVELGGRAMAKPLSSHRQAHP